MPRAFGNILLRPAPGRVSRGRVAAVLARRFSNAEIAQALGISPNTALRHTERVLAKLGVHTRLDVAARLRGGDVDQGRASGAT